MDAFFAGSKGGEWANSRKCVVDCVGGGGGRVEPGAKNLQSLDLQRLAHLHEGMSRKKDSDLSR